MGDSERKFQGRRLPMRPRYLPLLDDVNQAEAPSACRPEHRGALARPSLGPLGSPTRSVGSVLEKTMKDYDV